MTFWTNAGCLISLIKKRLISRLPRSFLHKHQLPFLIRQLVDLADVFREICQSSSRTSFSSRNGSSPEFVWKKQTNKKLWVTSDETAIFFPYQDFWLCTQCVGSFVSLHSCWCIVIAGGSERKNSQGKLKYERMRSQFDPSRIIFKFRFFLLLPLPAVDFPHSSRDPNEQI
jgi:hypothetical protein